MIALQHARQGEFRHVNSRALKRAAPNAGCIHNRIVFSMTNDHSSSRLGRRSIEEASTNRRRDIKEGGWIVKQAMNPMQRENILERSGKNHSRSSSALLSRRN